MNAYLSSSSGWELERLKRKTIFPVWAGLARENVLSFRCFHDEWWIADRPGLHHCFEGLVPMLAFEVDEIPELGLLISKFDLGARRLSNAVKDKREYAGDLVYDDTLTSEYRGKADFILRYTPRSISFLFTKRFIGWFRIKVPLFL